MLTWMTYAPSMRHLRPSMDPTSEPSPPPPRHSSNGSILLTDKEAILQRWPEDFEGLLNDQRIVQKSLLAKIPQVDVKMELDDPPTRGEIKTATMQLKVGKLQGIDGIPAEGYQYEGEEVLNKLQDLSPAIGRRGLYCRTSGMQSLSHCAKTKKENQTVQTIEALPYAPLQAKSWLFLLNRLIPTIAQENTSETQCGFRYNRGTADMVSSDAETGKMKRTEHRSFVTDVRNGQWKILTRLGCR